MYHEKHNFSYQIQSVLLVF